MLKAVIFDLDGVLIDTEELYVEHRVEFLKRMGYEISANFFKPLRGSHNRGYWEAVIKHLKLPHAIDELIKDSREDYIRFLKERKIELSTGARKLIEILYTEGIKLGVASSANPKRIQMILEETGISEKFEAVVSGDDIDNPKPAPDAYLKSAEVLGVDPSDCVAIEDTTLGIQSAKSAGMKVVGFIGPEDNTQDLSESDLIIKSFSGLNLEILKDLTP